MTEFVLLETRLDLVTTALLPSLRSTKTVDASALAELLDVTDGLAGLLGEADSVPRRLTGKLWFVFAAMLTEAEFASDPEPILTAAWGYQDRLRRVFGPTF